MVPLATDRSLSLRDSSSMSSPSVELDTNGGMLSGVLGELEAGCAIVDEANRVGVRLNDCACQ